ncbi:MAG: hypothetical protein ACRC20_05795 [Segniliparus sp.]|uniref:hypothetical protein n=1 Tax=Segniliparus sp. TaxID=2804064 RepID=UPI003F3115C6
MHTRAKFFGGAVAALTLLFFLGDHFAHVRHGILRYHWQPQLDGQSYWVYLVFFAASLLIVSAAWLFPVPSVPARPPWRTLITDYAVVAAGYTASGFFGNSHPRAFFWAVTALWLVRVLATRDDRLPVVAASVLLGALGSLGEGLFSQLGLFDYAHQDVVRVPLWLGALYLHGGFAVVDVSRVRRALGQEAGT